MTGYPLNPGNSTDLKVFAEDGASSPMAPLEAGRELCEHVVSRIGAALVRVLDHRSR